MRRPSRGTRAALLYVIPNTQVKSLIKTSNFHIRSLRHVRRDLTFESAKMIALGLVTSRLDHCNSLLSHQTQISSANIRRIYRLSLAIRWMPTSGDRKSEHSGNVYLASEIYVIC